jgi:hypothetical protein
LKDLTARFNNRTGYNVSERTVAGDCALVVTNDA